MRRVKRALDRSIDIASVALLCAIVVLVLLQISQRYVALYSIPWTEEMSRYLFVFLTFIGSSLLIKEKGHIFVDVVVDRLPRRWRLATYVVVQATVLLFLYFFVSGIQQLTFSTAGQRASSMPWFDMSYLYGGVWLGGALMFFYTAVEIVKGLSALRGNGERQGA